MQSSLFEPKDLPQFEASSPLAHAIFEDPLLAMGGIGLLGVLLLLAMRTRGRTAQGMMAFILAILIAGGLFVTSRLVSTDREIMSDRARELVEAVAIGDQFSMRSLMGSDIGVKSRFANAEGRDRVITLASSRVPPMVEEYKIPEIRADLPGPRVGRTMVKVRMQGSITPTTSSWWMIHWERDSESSDDWVAVYVEPIWIQGVSNPADQ